ncbi:MAG: hypothetical protein AMJ53_07335 [Gammaproteobacteria bacterium SG8_11]|nr:MAG: hypothetical protein AMJ53_07335 [Gammaproteobacteria bacterium SG8_11]
MIKLDPMIKLAIVVAIGVTITMMFGVGKPNDKDKLLIINKSQTNAAPLHNTAKIGGFPLDNYVALEK